VALMGFGRIGEMVLWNYVTTKQMVLTLCLPWW